MLSPGLLSPPLPHSFCLIPGKQATPAQCGRNTLTPCSVRLHWDNNDAADTHVLGGVGPVE